MKDVRTTLEAIFPTTVTARLRMSVLISRALFKAWSGQDLADWQRDWPFFERCAFLIARESTLHAFGLGKADGSGMARSRQFVNAMPWRTPATRNVTIDRCELAEGSDSPLEFLVASPARAKRRIYFLHGGGYAYFSPSHLNLIALAATQLEAEIWAPNYRLAPEHPWPSQLEDACAGYRSIFRFNDLAPPIVMGDSAGGHLLFRLLGEIPRRGLTLPSAAIALSPWADTTPSGQMASENNNDGVDWIFGFQAKRWAEWSRCDGDIQSIAETLSSAGGSRVPILVQYGSKELLAASIQAFESALTMLGPDSRITFQCGKDMPHDYPAFAALPHSAQAWRSMHAFVTACEARRDRGQLGD